MKGMERVGSTILIPEETLWKRIKKDFKKNKYVYLMALPMVVFYILFHYGPMYGILMAFKDFNPRVGVWRSTWVGFKHFKAFFSSIYFKRTFFNTLFLSVYSLLWGFPAAIILALLLNEVRNEKFKRTVQTVTYMPYFISTIVICGLIIDFTTTDGLINSILVKFGVQPTNWLTRPEWFRTIYISSGIWQSVGWDAIIFLAALAGIDPNLYEAAKIDGAGRWKRLIHITLPGIAPTIVILLILNIGGLMSVGAQKIINLYNPLTWETSDVISSYVYRKGLQDAQYSFSTAVGLFESVIGFSLLVFANWLSRRITEESLW